MGGLEIFLWVVLAVGIGIGLAALFGSRGTWEKYQERATLLDSTGPEPDADSPQAEAEIRQMLEASNARRARRGDAELDVERELARLRAPDPEVVEEIRALVEMRNRRLVRQGEPPLDVEAEVAKELAKL
ncbi:MAG: hypothetical protein J2O48_14070 [Solirubrobacterales bacterium]|nr:hypothetical protein [Solirubrobacterales bacterium]